MILKSSSSAVRLRVSNDGESGGTKRQRALFDEWMSDTTSDIYTSELFHVFIIFINSWFEFISRLNKTYFSSSITYVNTRYRRPAQSDCTSVTSPHNVSEFTRQLPIVFVHHGWRASSKENRLTFKIRQLISLLTIRVYVSAEIIEWYIVSAIG